MTTGRWAPGAPQAPTTPGGLWMATVRDTRDGTKWWTGTVSADRRGAWDDGVRTAEAWNEIETSALAEAMADAIRCRAIGWVCALAGCGFLVAALILTAPIAWHMLAGWQLFD